MNKDKNILFWLSNWYKSNCDGDWEHNYGVIIETIDNPGWSITIDIVNLTVIKDKDWQYHEVSPDDWYGYKIEDGKFEASGDSNKLEYLISLFKEIIESNDDFKLLK